MNFTTLTERNTRDFIERRPHKNTIKFAGNFINITGLAKKTKVDVTTLSRIFSSQRYPTLRQARILAETLKLSLDEFIQELDDRVVEKRQEADVA